MIVHTAFCDFQVTVPETAHTLDGFRQWAASDDFPDRGKISFYDGEVFVDMSPERVESHNQVKAEIGGVIGPLVKSLDSGKFYPDGLWITNDDADLSTEPDGTFISWETLESGRAETIPSKETAEDGLEMRGSPDWVLEIVSISSVKKDTRVLVEKYHQAGVREYWLIDARGEEIEFTIFAHQPDGYLTVEPQEGWLRSEVFDREFQLQRSRDRAGGWQYTLDVR